MKDSEDSAFSSATLITRGEEKLDENGKIERPSKLRLCAAELSRSGNIDELEDRNITQCGSTCAYSWAGGSASSS